MRPSRRFPVSLSSPFRLLSTVGGVVTSLLWASTVGYVVTSVRVKWLCCSAHLCVGWWFPSGFRVWGGGGSFGLHLRVARLSYGVSAWSLHFVGVVCCGFLGLGFTSFHGVPGFDYFCPCSWSSWVVGGSLSSYTGVRSACAGQRVVLYTVVPLSRRPSWPSVVLSFSPCLVSCAVGVVLWSGPGLLAACLPGGRKVRGAAFAHFAVVVLPYFV